MPSMPHDHPAGHGRAFTALVAGYPDWELEAFPGGLPVYSATHRTQDGRHIRVLVAHTPAELAAKLETASVVEP